MCENERQTILCFAFIFICTKRFAIFLFSCVSFRCCFSLLFRPFSLLTLWASAREWDFISLIFRAHILFPYLYLNFHSCTQDALREERRERKRIVCRFLDYIFFFLLLLSFWNPPFLPTLQHFLLHAIFICIHNFFFLFHSIQFFLCSSIAFFIRFLNYCCRARYKKTQRKLYVTTFFSSFQSQHILISSFFPFDLFEFYFPPFKWTIVVCRAIQTWIKVSFEAFLWWQRKMVKFLILNKSSILSPFLKVSLWTKSTVLWLRNGCVVRLHRFSIKVLVLLFLFSFGDQFKN